MLADDEWSNWSIVWFNGDYYVPEKPLKQLPQVFGVAKHLFRCKEEHTGEPVQFTEFNVTATFLLKQSKEINQ